MTVVTLPQSTFYLSSLCWLVSPPTMLVPREQTPWCLSAPGLPGTSHKRMNEGLHLCLSLSGLAFHPGELTPAMLPQGPSEKPEASLRQPNPLPPPFSPLCVTSERQGGEVFEKKHGLWSQKLWVSLVSYSLALLTEGNSLSFVDLCFLHLQNGITMIH